MPRRQKDPLRPFLETEREILARLSRSGGASAARVARARALLLVAEGRDYTTAARLVGRRVGDTVARWVADFNRDGLDALAPRHGGGHPLRYGEVEQRRILAEAARPPDRARDGTATWSLNTLRDALRRAEDGLPGISTHTIGRALHASGLSWQKNRSWCETGVVARKRKRGTVIVTDPDAAVKRG
jgi:transposase